MSKPRNRKTIRNIASPRSERGQAIVLIALFAVALLGFGALAIDGGLIYARRRQAQNAVDAAAMAAAISRIRGANENQWKEAATDQALVRGFDPADPMVLSVEVTSPPTEEPYHSDFNSDLYIQVSMTFDVEGAFAHLVFPGALRNTVTAIARSQSGINPARGVALYATDEQECKAVDIAGTGYVVVTDGDIYSNSLGSDDRCASAVTSGTSTVELDNADIVAAGRFVAGGDNTIILNGNQILDYQGQRGMPEIDPPPCPTTASQGRLSINEDMTIGPGNYGRILMAVGTTLTMEPGVYCIDGDFQASGATINGDDILIRIHRGRLMITGASAANLTPIHDPDHDYAGMLVYADLGVRTVQLVGSSASYYEGTIYATDAACEMAGSSEGTLFKTQMICNTVKVTGGGFLDITYEDAALYHGPPIVELAK